MLLHCSYNKKLHKMTNNKIQKLNTTKMPNNNNEKRDYHTGVSDGIKKF